MTKRYPEKTISIILIQSSRRDILKRILSEGRVKVASRVLCDQQILLKMKGKLYEMFIRSVMHYVAKSSTTKKQHIQSEHSSDEDAKKGEWQNWKR